MMQRIQSMSDFANQLDVFQLRHPYVVSFMISFLVMAFTLFYTPSEKAESMDEAMDVFQMINVDKILMPKRVSKKDIDINAEEESTDSDVERAEGLSEADDAVDLSFYPNVVPPRPIGRLKKIYPEEARQREVEATVYISLVIGKDGIVHAVNVISTRLSKPQPAEIAEMLKSKFSAAAVSIMKGARFSPPIIDGKKVSIMMEMPLKFELK